MAGSDFEKRLRELIGSDKYLMPLLEEAERLAQARGIYERRRGTEGYYTIGAALQLAIAVWKVEGERG